MRSTRPANASTSARADAGAEIAATTGALAASPPPRTIASATTRELLSFGITEESIADQTVLSEGSATASIAIAVSGATKRARRMTKWASRYQRSSASAAVPRERASLAPHSANSAGEMTSAASAATAATVAPAIPIDFRKPCGKIVSVMSAAETVAAENATVRPAVAIVVRMAPGVAPWTSSSSR